MKTNILFLTHHPHPSYLEGLLHPDDNEGQRLALMHFSGGNIAIGFKRIDEITYTAGLHGWKVVIVNDPRKETDA